MDAFTNATTTIACSPRPQPHHNILSPFPPPPPFAAAPPHLHWPTAAAAANSGGFSSKSFHLPLPSPAFVSCSPTAATPKKPRPPRRKPDAASTSSAATPRTATPPCTECGKRFSSWKALFGHMRCHPERQWRGINPPPHFRRLSSPGAAQFSHEEYQVATSLIMLANGPPRSEGEEGVASSEALGPARSCNAWYKGFSSGRALGGHKRCCWERGEDQAGSPKLAKSYALDLNLPPPTESNEGSPRPAVDLRLGI